MEQSSLCKIWCNNKRFKSWPDVIPEFKQTYSLFKREDVDSILKHPAFKEVKLVIETNKSDCIDFENTCIQSLDIEISNGIDVKIKLPKVLNNLRIKSEKTCVDSYNLSECNIVTKMELYGNIRNDGKCDLIIPSTESIIMNLMKESTFLCSRTFILSILISTNRKLEWEK